MSHYFQADLADEEHDLAMADWIGALGDVPQAALDQAISEWIRTEERRPTPAAIRKRALARVQKPEPGPEDVNRAPFAPKQIGEAELRRRREIAREMGMEVLDDGSPRVAIRRMTTSEAD